MKSILQQQFPLLPGKKKLTNIAIGVCTGQPEEKTVLHYMDGKERVVGGIFVVQEKLKFLFEKIMERYGQDHPFSPDHFRILVSAFEKNIGTRDIKPMFWIEEFGRREGSVLLVPMNDKSRVATFGKFQLCKRAHYDPETGEMTALFGGDSTSSFLNIGAQYFRGAAMDGLSRSEKKIVSGGIQLLSGLGYPSKSHNSDDLVKNTLSRITHTLFYQTR